MMGPKLRHTGAGAHPRYADHTKHACDGPWMRHRAFFDVAGRPLRRARVRSRSVDTGGEKTARGSKRWALAAASRRSTPTHRNCCRLKKASSMPWSASTRIIISARAQRLWTRVSRRSCGPKAKSRSRCPALCATSAASSRKKMAQSWKPEDVDTFHTCGWWRKRCLRSRSRSPISACSEMDAFEECWNEWLECDNPYAVGDRAAMNAGAGKYMNFVSFTCRRV